MPNETQAANIIVNGGFESGDFSGWTVDAPLYPVYRELFDPVVVGYQPEGTASVVQDATCAAEGSSYAAIVGTDLGGPGRAPGFLRSFTLSQDIYLREGQEVMGYASWITEDYLRSDVGWVSLFDDNGSSLATPWLMRSGSGPNSAYPANESAPIFGWDSWQWAAPVAGTYTLQLGYGSRDDGIFNGVAFFDNITLSSVPDGGSTLLLLGCALGLIGALGRRFRN